MWQTSGPPFSVYASRTDGGVWTDAHALLPPSPNDTDIENFAYTDTNDAGDVLGTISRFESGQNRFYGFRYDAGMGWLPAENPYTSTLGLSTRVRSIFYIGARAMGTLLGSQNGQTQLTSLRYTGTGWAPDLINVPGDHMAFFQHVIADAGEAMLIFEAEVNQGAKATWLRDGVGDMNCDGFVDLDDFAGFAPCVQGPDTPADPGCEEADIDGDGDADFADIGILQRFFASGS